MMRAFTTWLLCLTLTLPIASFAEVKQIDSEQLEQLIDQGVAVIDVRRPDEWLATGLLEGSHPLTFFDAKGQFDIEAWLAELDGLAKPENAVVLICASGVRSAQIATFLDTRLGFKKVYNVSRGISAWLGENRPVVPFKE